jgi:hemolysin D
MSSRAQSHPAAAKSGRWRLRRNAARVRPRPRADQEFLPAALELLETPPSPVQIRLLLAICAFVTISIGWMVIGRIDVIAMAQGKVQPVGRVKLVQPLETGRVRQLLIANGAKVQADQVLVVLDDSEVRSEEASLEDTVASLRTEIVRRSTAIEAAGNGSFEPRPADWPRGVPERILTREQRVLTGDLALLKSTVMSLAAQRRQKEAERARLVDTIAAQEELVKTSSTRGQLRGYLESKQLGSKLSVFDAEESMQNHHLSLVGQKGQLGETTAALDVIDRDMAKAVATFVADNSQKLADAERQLEDARQKLVKAQARTSHMTLRAPASGTVQALSINSIGQVVMPGEEIARIVPDDGKIEIECYMPNKDIGFVTVGQEAAIKVESFPFTQYGSLTARVTRVSREAIPEPDAQQQEGNPGRSAHSQVQGGAQRIQNLVFPVTLSLEGEGLTSRGARIPVSNGMAVTVEIKTGSRRIIDYLFSPLVEVSSRAMRER